MPTYDFKCRECGKVFEATKRMSEPNVPCECGGESDVTYKRVPPAHFHGGGWAADKYASTKPSMTVNQMLDRGAK